MAPRLPLGGFTGGECGPVLAPTLPSGAIGGQMQTRYATHADLYRLRTEIERELDRLTETVRLLSLVVERTTGAAKEGETR